MIQATKKRVLLVDDAVVVRKALAIAIAADPDLDVAGTAMNGRIALAKFHDVEAGHRPTRHRNARNGWTGDRSRITQDR